MNLTGIREAIARQIADFGISATARIPAATEITCPHAFISDMGLQFVSMGDAVDITFEVTVLVSLADADSGWDTISQLCDVGTSASLIDAVLSDRTLNHEVDGLTFIEIRSLGGSFDVGGMTFMGFQMAFTAHVRV